MAYSTVQQYVAIYGERETTLLTNATPPGAGQTATYDSIKVEEELDNASEVVDSYIGKRYVTPIEDPPRIVLGWVRVLAREALHVNTGRTNETVEGAANRARAQLLQVSKGDLTLPIEAGQEAPTAIVGNLGYAQSSNDGGPTPFSRGALDDYTGGMFGGGSRAGCWRQGT